MAGTLRWVLAALVLAVGVWARGPAPEPGPALLLLALLAVALELAAVPLAGAGFFSSAFAPVFALALLPGAGVRASLLALLAGLGLRSLLRSAGREGDRILREALSDLLPALAGLAAVAWLTPPGSPAGAGVGLLAYLPLAWKLPHALLAGLDRYGRGSWQRHREMTFLYLLGVAGLGPALALLVAGSPGNALWVCPLLFGLHRAAQLDLVRLDLLDRELLAAREQQSRRELTATRAELSHTSRELTQTSRELDQESQQRRQLEEALELYAQANARLDVWVRRQAYLLEGARELARGLAAEEILERYRELVKVTIPHSKGALLGPDRQPQNRWPQEWSKEEVDRVFQAAGAAAEDRAPVLLEPAGGPVLAVPLISEDRILGTLVLLSNQPEAFSREQMDVLLTLAYQTAVALENAYTHQQLKLSQAQVVQSSKMAAVGQLAAGVAHELNTPLSTVLMGVEAKLEKGDDPMLAMIRRAALRAREIVAKLLYYSREARVARQPTDLNQVLRDTLELIGNQLRLDGVTVECELGELPPVQANQNELQQVLTNLLLNARDAVREGRSRTVRVRTWSEEGWVGAEVHDDGPGVDPEIASKIFDPFFTTKPVGAGTGLGLSTSLQIVLAHGGRLELGPGPGGRFFVWLPVAVQEEPA